MCPYAQRVAIAGALGVAARQSRGRPRGSKGFTKDKAVETQAGLRRGLFRALDRRRDAPRVDGVRGARRRPRAEARAERRRRHRACALRRPDHRRARTRSSRTGETRVERALRDLDAKLTCERAGATSTADCVLFRFFASRAPIPADARPGPTSTARCIRRSATGGGRWWWWRRCCVFALDGVVAPRS